MSPTRDKLHREATRLTDESIKYGKQWGVSLGIDKLQIVKFSLQMKEFGRDEVISKIDEYISFLKEQEDVI